jgi:hypothetical protein
MRGDEFRRSRLHAFIGARSMIAGLQRVNAVLNQFVRLHRPSGKAIIDRIREYLIYSNSIF